MLETPQGSDRLRMFLMATRLAGLVLGLSLTSLSGTTDLPYGLAGQMKLVQAAIVMYELFGCVLTHMVRGPIAGLLVVFDTLIGFAVGRFFGAPYLLLGITLPVLEAAVFFSPSAGLFLGAIGGVFFGAFLLLPMISNLRAADVSTPTGAAVAAQMGGSLGLIATAAAFSMLMLALCNMTLAEARTRDQLAQEMEQEKELLFKEMNKKAQDIGKVYAEVGERETLVGQLEKKLRREETSRVELEDIVLQMEQELDNLKMTQGHLEQMAQAREEELLGELKRSRSGGEREQFVLQKKMERESLLLNVLRDLTGTLSLNDTLLALTNQLQTLLPSQSCVIFLVDEVDGHRELYPEVAASPFVDDFRNRILQMGEEAPGYCVQRVRPLRIENGSVQAEGRQITTLTPYEKSALVCPLRAHNDVLGAIYLGRTEANEFAPEEQEMLLRLCELAGTALGNSLEYQRQIQRGLHDPITHLYNGMYLEERLKEEVMRGRRYTYPVSLVLIELEGFDLFLRSAGEEATHPVLTEVAEIVRQATRETDVPARLNNAAFAILCVHTDRERARSVGERIRTAVETGFGRQGSPVRLQASIGIAGVPHDATNEEMLQKRATDALEVARAGGGNKVCFWDG